MSTVVETTELDNPRQNVIDFLADFTAETTPFSAAKVEDFREVLRPGSTVFITFLPGSDFEDTIAVAARFCRVSIRPASCGPYSERGLCENLGRLRRSRHQ